MGYPTSCNILGNMMYTVEVFAFYCTYPDGLDIGIFELLVKFFSTIRSIV
jgi:hypothetical protein